MKTLENPKLEKSQQKSSIPSVMCRLQHHPYQNYIK